MRTQPPSHGRATSADARARFNRTVLLAGAIITPVIALIEVTSNTLDRSVRATVNVSPYLVVIAVSVWQLRRPHPDARWLIYPVTFGLLALNVYEMSSETDVGGVSTGVTLAVVVTVGILGALIAERHWQTWTAVVAVSVTGWGVWVGLKEGLQQTDAVLHGVVPGFGIMLGAILVRWLVDKLEANAEEAERLATFHEAIAKCAEIMGDQHEGTQEAALGALLDATNAASVWITRNVEDPTRGLSFAMICEVLADGVEPDPEGLWDLVPWTAAPYSFDALSRGESIFYNVSDTGPAEQALYAPTDVTSECDIPIMINNEWHGTLGFSYTDERPEFHESDAELLQTAARIFGAHWKTLDQHAELEHLARSKDELIAAVSHELRTPLTGILGFSEELLARAGPEDREFIAVIADQSRDMADIIEDLLVTARVEVGNLSVARETVDLGQSVASVVASSTVQAAVTGHQFTVTEESVSAVGDPVRIRQIIRNLVTNALVHGGSEVAITLTKTPGQSIVSVWDNGRALSASAARQMFDRYYTGQRPLSQPGSVGLGLFLSRQLAQLMGGDLTVELNEQGTTFRLSLPNLLEPVDIGAG